MPYNDISTPRLCIVVYGDRKLLTGTRRRCPASAICPLTSDMCRLCCPNTDDKRLIFCRNVVRMLQKNDLWVKDNGNNYNHIYSYNYNDIQRNYNYTNNNHNARTVLINVHQLSFFIRLNAFAYASFSLKDFYL